MSGRTTSTKAASTDAALVARAVRQDPPLSVVYSDDYLRWNLGEGHPTDPRRAQNFMRILEATDVPHEVLRPRRAQPMELARVHSYGYINEVMRGFSSEWEGEQIDLADTARLMAGGTMLAVDRMLDGQVVRAFNPQGAKHHAHRDHGSGFCVFNDMAIAATRFADAGMKVLYLDWDVHHGDGVEALCLDMRGVTTASVHGDGFPYTGRENMPERGALNRTLHTAGDKGWLRAIHSLLNEALAREVPDVILLATGADSHRSDPLGRLRVTVDGYARAASVVRGVADAFCEGRVLIGGAGGYQPDYWTPMCWAAVAREMERARPGH